MKQPDLFGSNPHSWADIEGEYRYTLGRRFDLDGASRVVFVMLNPSIADESIPDPTLRRCIGFAKREGASSVEVVNLFALIATKPKALIGHPDPVGPRNNEAILAAVRDRADLVVCAWGANKMAKKRSADVLALLRKHVKTIYRIGPANKNGSPKHPLYIAAKMPLEAI